MPISQRPQGRPQRAPKTPDTSYYNDASALPDKGTTPDLIILGAGAAGLMTAITAAQRGKRVLLIDHGHKAGRKILIAGGGRCNFTNTNADPSEYVSGQAVFCRSALSRFTPWDMVAMLEAKGIPWEEREHGELFCTQSAEDLRDMLLERCRDLGCWFAMGHSISACSYNDQAALFTVDTDKGPFSAPKLLIATGSPAWEQVGATNIGYKLAKSLGHHIITPRPVLVPLTMPPLWPLHGLQGISLKAAVTAGGHTFTRDMLFTHRGLSGPAILSASCHWIEKAAITINFLPDLNIKEACESPEHRRQLVRTMLARLLPTRLAERLSTGPLKDFADRKAAELSKAQRQILADTVHAHAVIPSGTEGLRRAEAAAGGVHTKELNPKTLESRIQPNLYFAG
ncbi:MAG: NAD(P)/FAD-dependent oxidoreductase, partial [Pseudomonadota bacterium]